MSYKEAKEFAAAGTILGLGVGLFYTILAIFVIAGSAIGFWMYEYYAPKYEQVRYNTFKESQTYNDGMLRDLQDLQMEYMKANDDQKAALKAIVLHRFSVYDINRLPPDLRSFYASIR